MQDKSFSIGRYTHAHMCVYPYGNKEKKMATVMSDQKAKDGALDYIK